MALLTCAFLMIRFAFVLTEEADLTQFKTESTKKSLLQKSSCGASLLFDCDPCEVIRNLSAALTHNGPESNAERGHLQKSLISKCEGLQVCELRRSEFPASDKKCLTVNYTCERRKIWWRAFSGDSNGNANVSLRCDLQTQRLHVEDVVLSFISAGSKRCFKQSTNVNFTKTSCRGNSCRLRSALGELSSCGGNNRFNDAVFIYFACSGKGTADSSFCGYATKNGSTTMSSNTGQSVNIEDSSQKEKPKTSTAVKERVSNEVKEMGIQHSATTFASRGSFCGNATKNGSATMSSNTGQSVNIEDSSQKEKPKTSTAVKERVSNEVKEMGIQHSATTFASRGPTVALASNGFVLMIWSIVPFLSAVISTILSY